MGRLPSKVRGLRQISPCGVFIRIVETFLQIFTTEWVSRHNMIVTELSDEYSNSTSKCRQSIQYDEERGSDDVPSSQNPRPSQALTGPTSRYSSRSSPKETSQFGLPSHDPHDQSTGSYYRNKYPPQSPSSYSNPLQFSSTFSPNVQTSGRSEER